MILPVNVLFYKPAWQLSTQDSSPSIHTVWKMKSLKMLRTPNLYSDSNLHFWAVVFCTCTSGSYTAACSRKSLICALLHHMLQSKEIIQAPTFLSVTSKWNWKCSQSFSSHIAGLLNFGFSSIQNHYVLLALKGDMLASPLSADHSLANYVMLDITETSSFSCLPRDCMQQTRCRFKLHAMTFVEVCVSKISFLLWRYSVWFTILGMCGHCSIAFVHNTGQALLSSHL